MLLHQPRPIYRFADLEPVYFLGSPLHTIPPVTNACAVRFPDEDVATDNCLSVSTGDMNGKALHEGMLQEHRQYPFRTADILDM